MNFLLPAALFLLLLAPATSSAAGAPPAAPAFRAADVDTGVAIGYGIDIADVDGDARLDILLADKNLIVWYRNPSWQKSVMAEKLTALDHVCIAARDLDGDGKAEVAAGAGWNPGDTVGSGSVHYLLPPGDRAGRWEPVALHHEPTVHRMRWVTAADGSRELIVVPLHGRGNKAGEGDGVKILAYRPPANPKDAWKTEPIDATLHVTHNLDPVAWDGDREDEILVAGKEGVFLFDRQGSGWRREQLAGNEAAGGKSAGEFRGASEVRLGVLDGGGRFLSTVEPFHGNEVVVYTPPASGKGLWRRRVLDDSLKEAHALACGDLAGAGNDQLVAGWRNPDAAGKVGIRLYIPLDKEGKEWQRAMVDDNGMACEDLRLADLDADGDLDIVAAGRATRNLKVYFNQTRGK